jgi:hypothetical protein
MKKLPPIWLALIIGAVIEIAFVAILLSFGSFGHFVPANLPTGLLLVTQIPGIIIAIAAGFLLPKTLAPLLPETLWILFPILIIATNVIWMSALAYAIIQKKRRPPIPFSNP